MSGRTPAEQKGFSPSNLLWRAQDPRYPAQQGSVVTGHFSPVGAEPQNHNPQSLSYLPDFMGEVQWELREKEYDLMQGHPC